MTGTAEGDPFTRDQLSGMLDLASEGIQKLFVIQKQVLSDILAAEPPRQGR